MATGLGPYPQILAWSSFRKSLVHPENKGMMGNRNANRQLLGHNSNLKLVLTSFPPSLSLFILSVRLRMI